MNNKVVVVGSVNMDIVVSSKRLPRPGETLQGTDLRYIPGGKGANQAVAASRLGAEVSFIGKVGNDNFGKDLIDFLQNEKLNTQGVTQVSGSSGIALINVDEMGENSIIIVSGSNALVTKSYVEKYEETIKHSDIVVSQYETPIESVVTAFELAKKHHKITILNPAPALKTPDSLLKIVDYLILNEIELSYFSGDPRAIVHREQMITVAQKLLRKGVQTVIVTLGANGAITITKAKVFETKGLKVKSIDTTAAGDCFVGAFSARIASNHSLEDALSFANKAASLSVQKFGASSSIPFLKNLTD